MEDGKMPLFHCSKCHHEWEAVSKKSKCDWCGAEGVIIESSTPLERMLKYKLEEKPDVPRKDKGRVQISN
jgi:hypothetical protein